MRRSKGALFLSSAAALFDCSATSQRKVSASLQAETGAASASAVSCSRASSRPLKPHSAASVGSALTHRCWILLRAGHGVRFSHSHTNDSTSSELSSCEHSLTDTVSLLDVHRSRSTFFIRHASRARAARQRSTTGLASAPSLNYFKAVIYVCVAVAVTEQHRARSCV